MAIIISDHLLASSLAPALSTPLRLLLPRPVITSCCQSSWTLFDLPVFLDLSVMAACSLKHCVPVGMITAPLLPQLLFVVSCLVPILYLTSCCMTSERTSQVFFSPCTFGARTSVKTCLNDRRSARALQGFLHCSNPPSSPELGDSATPLFFSLPLACRPRFSP